MDTGSPVDDSTPDPTAWEQILALADRIDVERACGRPIDGELALQLARAIIRLDDSQHPTEPGPTTGTWRKR
jgi:hypothetical protein